MTRKFRLENVGKEVDIYASTGEAISGFGLFALTNERIEYHFREEDMSVDEAESYIEYSLNNLPEETVEELCKKMCAWKDHILTDCYPDMSCPDGLPDAQGRDILRFISVSDISIYRNPYNKNDPLLGASISAGMDWDFEDGIEIIIKGKEVLEVREFLGYGEHAIWEERDNEG
mgnify:CR=1 FL=1|jgi:hypothetical protein